MAVVSVSAEGLSPLFVVVGSTEGGPDGRTHRHKHECMSGRQGGEKRKHVLLSTAVVRLTLR